MTSIRRRVSVIIPTYNYAHFISEAIKSVLAQEEVSNIEILVVDDGSTDNTREVLEPFLPQITYIYQENQGLSAARNTGIENATGDYIQFLDSDDMLGKNAVIARASFLFEHPEASVVICRNRLFRSTSSIGYPKAFGEWRLFASDLDLHLCHFNIGPPHAFFMKRQVVDQVGTFDVSLKACEDYDYWLRAVIKGFIPHYCADGEVFYRNHSGSMSAKRSSQVHHDAIMHQRLYDCLLVDGTYQVNNMPVALLALASGVATTVVRLGQLDPKSPQIDILCEILQSVFEALDTRILSQISQNGLTGRLYAMILANMISQRREVKKSMEPFHRLRTLLSDLLSISGTTRAILEASFASLDRTRRTEALRTLRAITKFRQNRTRMT